MWTSTKVRAHFKGLPENTLVTRRDLLNYGTQDAVDSTLRDLLKQKIIVRMAWGVYTRPHPIEALPTAAKVAAVRIGAFRRKQVTSALDSAKEHGLVDRGEIAIVHEVDASTSSFRVFDTPDRGTCRVFLVRRVARKIHLESTPALRAIKALWCLGKTQCTPRIIQQAVRNFTHEDRREFRTALRWPR